MIALAGGARTPICRGGGALRDVPAHALALTAAREALRIAGVEAADLGAVLALCALPSSADELDLAASLVRDLEAGGCLAVGGGGSSTSGFGAFVAGVALSERTGRPVLVAGADSASRAPYWARTPRQGQGHGDASLLDPLGAAIAAAQPGPGGPDRQAQDAYAARSHALSRGRPPAEPVIAVSGVTADEPAAGDRSIEALAALKPLFAPDGCATAGNTALPADGGVAIVLVPDGAGPRVGSSGGTHVAAEVLETTAAAVLARHPAEVNPAGGAIGQGLPLGCGALLMALRLAARLEPGRCGFLHAGAAELALSA